MSKDPEKYHDKEAQARFEAALRGDRSTPHNPPKDKPKIGSHRAGKMILPEPQERPEKPQKG